MKRKKNKKYIIILLIIMIIIINKDEIVKTYNNYQIINNIEEYNQIIDENGFINNDYLGIIEGDNIKNSKQNTIGINRAIAYASENNISNLKLRKGTYYIDGRTEGDTLKAIDKGICLKSNINLDLNGSTLKHIPNDNTNYAIFSILNQNNISIKNGILIGDKEEHTEGNGANDKGFGVDIRGGSNIEIDNLYICNMIGEAVLMREMDINNVTMQPNNIVIKNCIITNNRRQGISVVSGSDIYIHDNEIYNIAGKNPQACIDIESDGWAKQKNTNINIYNNKLYDSISKLAIMAYNGLYDGKIYNNEITGRILITNVKDYIYIHGNKINSGGIIINKDYYTENNKFQVNKVIIKNNEIKNSEVVIRENQFTMFEGNTLINSKMTITPINFVLSNNQSNKELNILYGNEGAKLFNVNNEYQVFNMEDNIENIENENEINSMIQKIMLGVE